MLLERNVRNVKVSGLSTRKMTVVIDSQTIKNLVSNYSRPYEACIRELSINAYESHLAAGKPDTPFELHMPTKLEPWFSITDYGIGMSEYDIWELYACIGSSSKRLSNDYTGAFGVGGLSPYSITNMFTIQSVHNGKKFVYLCHLNAEGIPCLSESPENGIDTDQPNGVMVKFDISHGEHYKLTQALKPALQYLKVKPIITGHSEDWTPKATLIEGNNFKVFKDYSSTPNLIVMGQIAYPFRSGDPPYFNQRYNFELEVPIGAVDINSSRETLQFSEKTKDCLDNAINKMRQEIQTKLQVEIDKEDCGWNKALKSIELNRAFGITIKYPEGFSKIGPKKAYRMFGDVGYAGFRMCEIKKKERGGVRFVLNDMKMGAITRCRELANSFGTTVLIQAADEALALKELGLKKSHLILASTLDKPVVTRTSRAVGKGKVQKLERYEKNHITYCWSTPDALTKEGVYCDILNHKTILCKEETTPMEINHILDFLKIYRVDIPTVYGIKKGGSPEPGWIPLEDFLKTHCVKQLQKYVDDLHRPFIRNYDFEILKKFFDFKDMKPTCLVSTQYKSLEKWFTFPKPNVDNRWNDFTKELFFYPSLSNLKDPQIKDAFITLSKKYVRTFKLLEQK
jgi:hypothetical protein